MRPWGRYLVPATLVAAMLALAMSALAAGLTPYQPGWWRGAVSLAVLGGITPMIYAVNLRIVPVFARRAWPSARWPRLQIGLAIAGAWLVFAGTIAGNVGIGRRRQRPGTRRWCGLHGEHPGPLPPTSDTARATAAVSRSS